MELYCPSVSVRNGSLFVCVCVCVTHTNNVSRFGQLQTADTVTDEAMNMPHLHNLLNAVLVFVVWNK